MNALNAKTSDANAEIPRPTHAMVLLSAITRCLLANRLPLLGQLNARLRVRVGLEQDHESHRRLSFWFRALIGPSTGCELSLYCRDERGSARSTRRTKFFR